MNREVLVELWWELFNWRWVNGMVSSIWTSSMVVPAPKTRSKGAFRTEEFHGIRIFGVSGVQSNVFDYPGKACEGSRRKAIIGGGARWLQEGKRMSRSDSDLTLLGQTMMLRKKKGMLTAFDDFS